MQEKEEELEDCFISEPDSEPHPPPAHLELNEEISRKINMQLPAN